MALKECTLTHPGAKAKTRTHPAVLIHSQTGSTVWLWCYGKYSNRGEQRTPAKLGQACKAVDLGKRQRTIIIVCLTYSERENNSNVFYTIIYIGIFVESPSSCVLPGVRGGLNLRCCAAVILAARLIGRGDKLLP